MIMISMFAFMTEVLEEFGQDDTFGVDWAWNVKFARRVINHCRPSHFVGWGMIHSRGPHDGSSTFKGQC